GGRGRAEVGELLHAGELLLDRRCHRARERLGARAGIGGEDLHRRRRDLGVLRHREELRRHEAGEHDDDGNDAREDRTMNEELRHQPAFFPWTGVPGRSRTRLSTITLSPLFRPSSTTQSLPIQLPARIGRWVAFPLSATHTKRPLSFCITAACGTTNACCEPATTRTRTYWPGRSASFGLDSS